MADIERLGRECRHRCLFSRKHAVYSASKAAIVCFTRILALELGEHGIRANAILPGATETEMLQDVFDDDLICQELTINGSRAFTPPEFNELIALVRRGLPVERIVTHCFPQAEADAAFSLFRSAECGKILFTA